MKINLNSLAQELPAWEFQVVVDGVTYPTRPLSEGDLRFIAEMQAGHVQDVGRILGFFEGLFPAGRPNLARFDQDLLTVLLAEMLLYSRQRVQRWRDAQTPPQHPPRGGPLN
jgi:hypothetical protein